MTSTPSSLSLRSRIFGCWLGKSIGGTLGLPVEGKMDRLHFTFYDPVPTIAPPNDDLELQLVWLHLIETLQDGTLTQQHFADAWLNHLHYMWDEYGRCRWNLRRGVPVAAVGTFENNFVSGMGSPIRSEIWACLFPGEPASAAYYAALDASLDHGVEGIAGEVLLAVMQSLVATGMSVARPTAKPPVHSRWFVLRLKIKRRCGGLASSSSPNTETTTLRTRRSTSALRSGRYSTAKVILRRVSCSL